jgi:phospholipid/cholesterol/gamma-HCH transport system substrate-binding protein
MKDKKRGTRTEIWVGGFVVVGIVALFVAILLIGKERHYFEKKYQIKTVFTKIAGLRLGAPVKLGGIDVGNVNNLLFNEQGKIEVILEIRRRFKNQIRQDSMARISTLGLMGDKIVEITVGSTAYPSLGVGETLNSEDPLDVTDIIELAKPSLKDLERALKNIAEFTEKLEKGQGQLTALVDNLKSISDQLTYGEGSLAQLLKDKETYQELRTFTSSGAKAAKDLQETLGRSLPKVEVAVDNAEKASQDLTVTIKNLRLASEDLPETLRLGKEAMVSINKAVKNVQGSWLLGGGTAGPEKTSALGRAPARIDLYGPMPLGSAPKEGAK